LPTAAGANTFFRSANERNTYGDLYQWGRIADGHENRNAIPVNTGTGGVDATDNCIIWNTTTPPTYENGILVSVEYAPKQQVTRGTSYYGKFIKTLAASDWNWYVGLQTDADMLWRENGCPWNDPCAKVNTSTGTVPSGNTPEWYPAAGGNEVNSGWRMPTSQEWSTIFQGGNNIASFDQAYANTWSMFRLNPSDPNEGANGVAIKPAGDTTTLFLPATGRRNAYDGFLFNSGYGGYYWSCSTSATDAIALTFQNRVNVKADNWRAYGFALRCVKN